MPLFKFRICWEEDDAVYRDIAILSGQSFDDFQKIILNAFEFKKDLPASFYESNERWVKGREISSLVLFNKIESPVLSMIKTKLSALVNQPEKRFIFSYDPDKEWIFLITLIGVEKNPSEEIEFPIILKSEGAPPHKTVTNPTSEEGKDESEDKFDLDLDKLDEQGFNREDD